MTLFESLLLLALLVASWRLRIHRRNLTRMLNWISGPLDAPVPHVDGIWGEFVSRMNQRVRTRQQEKNQLEVALEQFQSALEALPDGVIFMNGHRQILWMNSLAVSMLDLLPGQDTGTPIEHLIRDPEFVSYIQSQHFEEALIYHPARRIDACYMITLISYGDDRLLLTARDLTRLEKLENVRRDFVANVSHELKTPLTVVSGFLETLQQHPSLAVEKRQRFIELALLQAQQMNRLVQDLLTLSTLESRVNFADEQDIAVYPLLRELVDAAQTLSNEPHEIIINCPENLTLRGSAGSLRSIFGNLISNAVHYTPVAGNIHIEWNESDNEGHIKVSDTGIGIPAVHLPRISERFYRVDQGRSREKGGTGLGLAIVKHALERHQGRLEIKSTEGKGSHFYAHFPRRRIVRN